MKNCIGIIFDLSSRTKHQFSNIDADISGDVIGSFLPFLKLLSSSIDDQFDIFIGAKGVDYRYGRIYDILLFLKYLSSCENLPIIEPSVNGRNNSMRIFIKKLQEAGAENISQVAERELTESQCQYLLEVFQNDPNIFYEIGFEEYHKFHKESSHQYFELYPQTKHF